MDSKQMHYNQTVKTFFVTGIGTDIGKTVVSAILAEALQSHYWKPIQAGDLDNSDSRKIQRWTDSVRIFEERFRLNNPLSPHTSARMDGVVINSGFPIPTTENSLLIEGAGGIMVPINDEGKTISDLLEYWKIPVIVVVKHYLGSINHTLLTLNYLKQRHIPITGIVVTGDPHDESEKIIERITGLKVNLHIPYAVEVDKHFVVQQATINKEKIQQWLLG